MSLGVFSAPTLENATFISHGAVPNSNSNGFGTGFGGKQCQDLNGRTIPQGVHFVPGPDQCTLCVCDEGGPKWCKAVLCSPPQDCKSFRVGNSCCDFICLDDSLKKGKGFGVVTTGGPFGDFGSIDMSDVIPKVVIASITAMLSLSLLFFLVRRLRKREIQGRRNSAAAARRSGQMCDECDDTRSLDFSMYDFDRSPHSNSDYFPPQYLAWWKRPSSYFPPRGEAPPPYEEAIATSGPPNSFLTINNSNRVNTTILTNENINQLQLASTAEPSAPDLEPDGNKLSPLRQGRDQPTAGPSRPSPPTTLATGNVVQGATAVKPASTNDASLPAYDAVAFTRGRDCFRHSLTLPRRPTFDEMREFGLVLDGSNNNYFRRNRQRFSLQLNVNVDDSSSSSSTVSMSPSITPIDHRDNIPSSSSSSSNFS